MQFCLQCSDGFGLHLLFSCLLEQGAYGQCRLVSVTFGLLYALLASNLIVAHMAKEPVSVPAWAYGLLLIGGVNRQLRLVDSRVLAAALMAVAVVGYGHYVVSVVNAICLHLKIKVFVIKVHAK